MPYLAFDIGRARTGIAVSDKTHTLASPYRTLAVSDWIKNTKLPLTEDAVLVDDVLEIIKEFEPSLLVFGLPISTDGRLRQNAKDIQEFAKYIERESGVSAIFQDERYTTLMAHAQLKSLGRQPSRNRNIVDQMAAVNILQEYIDSQNISAI